MCDLDFVARTAGFASARFVSQAPGDTPCPTRLGIQGRGQRFSTACCCPRPGANVSTPKRMGLGIDQLQRMGHRAMCFPLNHVTSELLQSREFLIFRAFHFLNLKASGSPFHFEIGKAEPVLLAAVPANATTRARSKPFAPARTRSQPLATVRNSNQPQATEAQCSPPVPMLFDNESKHQVSKA